MLEGTNVERRADASRPRVVVCGAGGHARVVADAILAAGRLEIVGFLDSANPASRGQAFCGRTILGGDEQLETLWQCGVRAAVVAVGDNLARLRIAAELEARGFELPVVIHPRAIVALDATMGRGTFFAAGAVVSANATIGACAIINHLASVDHDCVLAEGVHVSPGGRLAGGVRVGRASWIGINAAVRERIEIGERVIVGAGAAVIRNVEDLVVVGGVPAKVLKRVEPRDEVDPKDVPRKKSPLAPPLSTGDRETDQGLSEDYVEVAGRPIVFDERDPPPRPPGDDRRARTTLAIDGGKPAFAEKRFVGRPNIPNTARLMRRIEEAIERRWLTNDGPLVQEFEAELSRRMDGAHVVAVNNATQGLQLAIRALGLAGEAIVPAMTFVATAHALEWEGVTPVFCDVDPRTQNIDPEDVASRINERTSAIVGVHLWGRPCPVDELTAIARERGLKLIFDAAHALGSSHGGRPIGQFGDAEVFSFHATKFVNALEGGAIVTTSAETAHSLRLLRNFGFTGIDQVAQLGTNAKMNEFSAAMGLSCLEEIDSFLETNRRNYEAYREALAGLPGIRLNEPPPGEAFNYQYVVLAVDSQACPLSRDQLVEMLWAENVIARRYFYPGCHRVPPYSTRSIALLPHTEMLCSSLLALPTGTAVSIADIHTIGGRIRVACERARSSRGRKRSSTQAKAA